MLGSLSARCCVHRIVLDSVDCGKTPKYGSKRACHENFNAMPSIGQALHVAPEFKYKALETEAGARHRYYVGRFDFPAVSEIADICAVSRVARSRSADDSSEGFQEHTYVFNSVVDIYLIYFCIKYYLK